MNFWIKYSLLIFYFAVPQLQAQEISTNTTKRYQFSMGFERITLYDKTNAKLGGLKKTLDGIHLAFLRPFLFKQKYILKPSFELTHYRNFTAPKKEINSSELALQFGMKLNKTSLIPGIKASMGWFISQSNDPFESREIQSTFITYGGQLLLSRHSNEKSSLPLTVAFGILYAKLNKVKVGGVKENDNGSIKIFRLSITYDFLF